MAMNLRKMENPTRMSRNEKLYFRDTGIFIHSSADGKLLISSDGSGADDITLTGNVTFTNDVAISGAMAFGDLSTDAITLTGLMTVATDQKIQFRDTGIYINSGADGKLTITADGTGADDITLSGSVTCSDGITVSTTTTGITMSGAYTTGISMTGNCGTAVIKMGSSGSPLVNDTAIEGFVVGYFDSGATSGWPAGLFISTNLTEAGGSFTALQGDAVLTAAKATVTGIENFMQVSTGGSVTGACRSVQGTIDFSNEDKGSGGVYSGACFNIKGEGAACDIGTTQRVSCIELKTEGTFSAVGGENFQTKSAGYAIYVNGFTGGAGAVLNSTTLTLSAGAPDTAIGLRVGVGGDADAGAVYYIPLIPAADWN